MRVVAPPAALMELATGQHGILTLKQMLSLGWARGRALELARSQQWPLVMPGAYAIAPGDAWKQRALAACLSSGADAVASHVTAAKLHGLDGISPSPKPSATAEDVHISVSPSRRPRGRKGIVIHRARKLGPECREVREGIPCTTLLRTVADLASVLDEQDLAYAVESAWRADSGLLEDIEPWLNEHGQGLEGIKVLRRVLADCMERSHKPMDSALEVRLWRWLKEANLPRPRPQEPYSGHGDYVRFIDFAYLPQRLALETDGFEFHRDRESFEKDAAKLSYLAANGWRVIHVTWRMLDAKAVQLKKWIELALADGAAPAL